MSEFLSSSKESPILDTNAKHEDALSTEHKLEHDIHLTNSEAPESYDWNKLDRFAKYIEEQDLQRARRERLECERRMRLDLDKQVKDIQARKEKEKRDNVEYYRNLTMEVEEWKELDRKISEDRRSKAEIERKDRDEQMELGELKKREAANKRHLEDKIMLDRIEAEIKEEERDSIEKKNGERLLIKKLMKENEENRLRKQEMKKAQEAQDLRQLQEYNDLIERQERERQAELSQTIERQKHLIKRMEENVMKKIEEKSNDDNIRALKQQAERDARSIEVETFKAKRLAELNAEMRATLRLQLEEKEGRKKEEKEIRDLHAQILRLDSQDFSKSEEERRTLRRKLVDTYKQQLDAQMASLTVRRNADKGEMSKSEVLMNKDLIAVVEKVLTEKHRNS